MARFFVESGMIKDNYIILDKESDYRHMTKVLRLKEGDKVQISDGEKWEYETEIQSLGDGFAKLRIMDKQAFAREPEIKVSLFQGVPKGSKMELIIQKCVEEGIYEIVPVFMKRSVVLDTGKFNKKIERWQKIADEAVKQCKRGIIPKIQDPMDAKELSNIFDRFDLVLMPYENEDGYSIKDALLENQDAKNIAIIIGPEGGFSDEEAASYIEAGAKSVTLGKTILRTETAGLVALAMTMYQLEL
ncbi:MAG: 16S rRNA (uracil(1498)-N(3))-methyltransferase [Clostridia bacterium]|nr:16S rRNA (uracil(1498)-N(3))-methyltransferase [Clostridia bacterium]